MHCCVQSCENCTYRTSKNVSFHKFPKSEPMKEKWMEILKIQQINEKSLVCSNHFHQSDFTNDKTYRRLFRSAMPYFIEGQLNKKSTFSNAMNQTNGNVILQPITNNFATETESAVKVIFLQPQKPEKDLIEFEMEIPLSPSPSKDSLESLESDDDNIESNHPIDKKMTVKRALYSSDDSCSSSKLSPIGKKMKKELKALRKSVLKSKRQIKTLNETFRRRARSIARANEIIYNLKKQQLISVKAIATTTTTKSPKKITSPARAKAAVTKVKRNRAIKPTKNKKKSKIPKEKQNATSKINSEEGQSQKPPDPWEDHLMALITNEENLKNNV